MASSAMHLAVAKTYFQKHSTLDLKHFLAGTLYPDAASDKDKSHYTNPNRGKDNLSHVRGKVDLYDFLKDHPIFDDFTFGWFMHLVTDYLFFEECFQEDYLKEHTYQEFCHDLYISYQALNPYLTSNYSLTKEDYEAYPTEYYDKTTNQESFLSKKMIDSFIERVSSIDYARYVSLILEKKKNVKPEEKGRQIDALTLLVDGLIPSDSMEYLKTVEGILNMQVFHQDNHLDISYDSKKISLFILAHEILFALGYLNIPSIISFDKHGEHPTKQYSIILKDMCCEYCFKQFVTELLLIKGVEKVSHYANMDDLTKDISVLIDYDDTVLPCEKLVEIEQEWNR